MKERYLISFDALRDGLQERDPDALDASIYLLEHAHYQSRSQIVLFVATRDAPALEEILRAWLKGPWPAQSAAWWTLAYNARRAPDLADAIDAALSPYDLIQRDAHEHVGVQICAWLYERLVHGQISPKDVDARIVDILHSWLQADHPQRALSSLQALLALNAKVSRQDAARAVAHAEDAGIEDADVIGLRCGFLESAERLVHHVLTEGPWADLAEQAFVQMLPETARAQLESVPLRRRGAPRERDIRVATILAAHGDNGALQWLETACTARDTRRRALAWAGRVRALRDPHQQEALKHVGKLLLREPEHVRAWVLSTLDPQCPIQRRWLDQGREYGTEEEKSAVEDAMRTYLYKRPLIPDRAR